MSVLCIYFLQRFSREFTYYLLKHYILLFIISCLKKQEYVKVMQDYMVNGVIIILAQDVNFTSFVKEKASHSDMGLQSSGLSIQFFKTANVNFGHCFTLGRLRSILIPKNSKITFIIFIQFKFVRFLLLLLYNYYHYYNFFLGLFFSVRNLLRIMQSRIPWNTLDNLDNFSQSF